MIGAAIDLYEQLFEKSETARCITNEFDVILFANWRFRQVFEIENSKIISGKFKLQEVFALKIHKSDLVEFEQDLESFLRSGVNSQGKFSISSTVRGKTKYDYLRAKLKSDGSSIISYEFFDVTEKIEYRKSLRSTYERLEIAAKVSDLGIWEFEFESKEWHLNDTVFYLLGVDKLKFDGTPEGFTEVIDPLELPYLYAAWDNSKLNGEQLNLSIRINHPKKGRRTIHVAGKALYKTEGALWRFVGTLSDVTRQKTKEEEIIRDGERLKSLVDSQSNFIIRITETGNITFCNRSFREAFSKDLMCSGQHNLSEFLNSKDFGSVMQIVELCKSKPQQNFSILTDATPTNEILNIDWEFTSIHGSKGEFIEIQGMGRDVSDRVALLSRVEEAYSNINSLINNFNEVSIWSVDLDYRLTASNEYFDQQFEILNLNKINIGDKILELVHPENTIDWKSMYDRAISNGPHNLNIEIDNYIFEVSFNPIIINGEVSGVAAFGRDITQAKNAEKTIKLSQERLRFALESNKYMVWDLNLPSGIINFSETFYEFFGYLHNEFERDVLLFNKLVHPDDLNDVNNVFTKISTGEIHEFDVEFRMQNSSGEYIWLRNLGRTFEQSENGQSARIIGILEDISNKKNTENEVNNYLEKLEKFAYLTSHNLRKPVANILGLSSLMQDEQNLSPSVKDFLIELKRSTFQLDQVIKEMTEAISFGNGNLKIGKTINFQTVWFIDDDEINNMLSERLISRVMPKASVHSFLYAEDALDLLKQEPSKLPDAIFLDINMPRMNGWEFLDSISVLNISVNIYMLTSSIDPRDQEKASKFSQVNDFISKPLREDRLRLIID